MSDRPRIESPKFYVLLALSQGPMHGLAVQQQIVGDGMGLYLRPSTIYAALEALVAAGWVEAADDGNGYRKTFRLNEQGARALEQEARTLRRAVQLAQGRLGLRP